MARESLAGDRLAELRRQVARIEGRPGCGVLAGEEPPVHPLGAERLDRVLGGGLWRGALHEVRAAESRDAGAATGFAVALLARIGLADRRPVLWVAVGPALAEAGLPYGPGLLALGFDPGRLLLVRVGRVEEALWVAEEGLGCAGLAAVVAEIRGHPKPLDLTAGRRLALRAEAAAGLGLLLRHAAAPEPGAAATRWLVAARPSLPDRFGGLGPPAWRVGLERNRAGPAGGFDLEWDHVGRCFAAVPAAADPRPRFALPRHRPAAAAGPARRQAG